MTIGLWVTAIIIAVIGIICSIGFFTSSSTSGSIALLLTFIITASFIGGGFWWCNNTASGARALKDQESEFNNGIMREITITAEDGREIYHYIGRCDIETNDNYIIFEDEQGLRQMIYWGVTDTIIISEIEV